jgi:hypothetical protein
MLSEKDSLICVVSDTYKSLHGLRPRHFVWGRMSCQDLEAELKELRTDLKLLLEEESEQALCKRYEDERYAEAENTKLR